MRLLSTAASAMAIGLLASSSARADDRCTVIDEPIMTMFSSDHCTSPVGFCTEGTVGPGALNGTTLFTALTIRQPTLDVIHYTGRLVITTSPGDTFTIRDHGILNLTTGAFFEIDKVVAGTGKFEGAKGLLTSQGLVSMGIAKFAGTLTGRICTKGGDRSFDAEDSDE